LTNGEGGGYDEPHVSALVTGVEVENLNAQELLRQISSGAGLIYVVTVNERRLEQMVVQSAGRIRDAGSPLVWNCADGLSRDGVRLPDTADPLTALTVAMDHPDARILFFKDLPYFWNDTPALLRRLKELAAGTRGRGKVVIITGEELQIPEPLRGELVILYQGLPTLDEITAYLEQLREREPVLKGICTVDPELLPRLALAAQGLDLAPIERAVRMLRLSRTPDGGDAIRTLFELKRRIIRESGIMEFVDNDVSTDQVGGMENLKQWMLRREKAYGLETIASGMRLPKGILIMGVAGCGKSLFVKAIAAQWRLPLIRLDMSSVYGGLYGSPESSLQRAFRTAEAIAPCVLWIDEIESGISSQGFKSEGGTASRVLGTFLTWMQEKRAPVFVAATANAIEMLPAEVLRKGRFDEIFYAGLPDAPGREEIFRIHLTRQGVLPAEYDIPLLSGSTRGFSGSEIEQAVLAGSFDALSERRPLTQQDLMAAISRTVPLSVTMAEQIKKIEAWAFKRAVPASGKFNQ
jgi:AAA+ superfamily predicted ATPase